MDFAYPVWQCIESYLEITTPAEYLTYAKVNRSFARFFLSDQTWARFNVHEESNVAFHYEQACLNLIGRNIVSAQEFQSCRYIQLISLCHKTHLLPLDIVELIHPNVWRAWASFRGFTYSSYPWCVQRSPRLENVERDVYLRLAECDGVWAIGPKYVEDREVAEALAAIYHPHFELVDWSKWPQYTSDEEFVCTAIFNNFDFVEQVHESLKNNVRVRQVTAEARAAKATWEEESQSFDIYEKEEGRAHTCACPTRCN